MENLYKVGSDALAKYFDTLHKLGYVRKNTTSSMLCLLFVNDFMWEFSDYLTSEDNKVLQNVVACLTNGSCLTTQRSTGTTPVSYLFTVSSTESEINYTSHITQATTIKGNIKGRTVSLVISGTKQRIVLVSKDRNLAIAYNDFVFPTTVTAVGNGYYMYVSQNTYSTQNMQLTIE